MPLKVRSRYLHEVSDEIIYAYAEIAILEAQGDQRRATGSLSIMSFVERAKSIERRLQRQPNKDTNATGSGIAYTSSSPAGGGAASVTGNSPQVFFSPLSPPATATSTGSPASVHLDTFSSGVGRGASRSPAAPNYAHLQESRDMENLFGEIFRIGAFVYLYSVLNGHYPSTYHSSLIVFWISNTVL